MGKTKDKTIVIVVVDRNNGVASYSCRIWASRTSFYIKHRAELGVKISLHGPDPRHTAPGFKFALDGSAVASAHEKSRWRFEEGSGMGWFPGVEVEPGVHRIVRLRFPWSAFQKGAPSGPMPTLSKGVGQHFSIQAPPLLKAADVDLYLSDTGTPYWPDEERARRDNALLGPLENEAGQLLTGVGVRRDLLHDRATADTDRLARGHTGPRTRAIEARVDDQGLLWIREQIVPQDMLRVYGEAEFRAAAGLPPLKT